MSKHKTEPKALAPTTEVTDWTTFHMPTFQC